MICACPGCPFCRSAYLFNTSTLERETDDAFGNGGGERAAIVVAHLEDRALAAADFDYAFDEFKPISVKLLDDDTSRTNRTAFHWPDVGGMDTIKQELVQTVQWRFEVGRR